ncbi:MAG: LD-carboxypeptidase [Bacteroidetes bacterium]|nr:LD-carboxypeptidase [Bacteroidota bacterium]
MISPPYLKKGDTIAIVGPAGKISEKQVEKTVETLKNWGFQVTVGKHLFDNQYGYSASDAKRVSDFQTMLDKAEVKAILCARGGYGTNRIVDQLDFSKFNQLPKWIIGFSDITVIHSHIHQNFGVETIHGTMAAGFGNMNTYPETTETLHKALLGKLKGYRFESHKLSRNGTGSGVLTGGNLAILCSLIGTRSDIDTQQKILFIEEVGEHLYRIDRMMVQLKRAGKLDGLAGLLVGGMDELPDTRKDFGKSVYEIITNATGDYDYPVAFDFPGGHGNDNRVLLLGRPCTMKVETNTVLNFSAPFGSNV